jgi:hypothetical protein
MQLARNTILRESILSGFQAHRTTSFCAKPATVAALWRCTHTRQKITGIVVQPYKIHLVRSTDVCCGLESERWWQAFCKYWEGASGSAIRSMAKPSTPEAVAAGLSTRERILLFCVASSTDWQRAGVLGETVTAVIVKGLIIRDAIGQLTLTERGWAVLRALLQE